MKRIDHLIKSLVALFKQKPGVTAEDEVKTHPPASEDHLPREARGWLAELIERCEAYGRAVARKTRAHRAEAVALKSLEEQAAAWARAATPTPFAPNKNELDKRAYEWLLRLDERLIEKRELIDIAAAEWRKRDDEVARSGPQPPFPAISVGFKIAANIAISVGITLILHDLMSGMQPALRWAASFLCAEPFAYFIVNAAIPSQRPEDAHADISGIGSFQGVMLSGVVTSIAFFGARLALARTYRDLLLAISTALLEVGILIHLERRGVKLRADRAKWAADRDERQRRLALRQAAWDEWQRHLQDERDMKEQSVGIEVKHMNGRVAVDVDANIALCVAAARGGYVAQLAENKAKGIVPNDEE
jgi:hypothetical protein